ncbi:hypothetical protein BDV34DRAFT_229547 [Aspergillus parasiticus]|uniref:Uncharacterized protein n=1 Tax=Aspergillus parasiticus TaxID=5067 RepID=A0A5N6D887_ASPPA|nr:hypothetical protein BDV34DRAFT_229547 [Aspergillus parasiticus]
MELHASFGREEPDEYTTATTTTAAAPNNIKVSSSATMRRKASPADDELSNLGLATLTGSMEKICTSCRTRLLLLCVLGSNLASGGCGLFAWTVLSSPPDNLKCSSGDKASLYKSENFKDAVRDCAYAACSQNVAPTFIEEVQSVCAATKC